MTIRFAKAEACGNDFLLVAASDAPEADAGLARAMCDRLTGVGADGLILYRPEGRGFFMRLFNSDGSFAEISGNGLRCLGAWLVLEELAGDAIEITTGAGLASLALISRTGARFQFRADMGSPKAIETGVVLGIDDDGGIEEIVATTLSMGNPHCVVFTEPTRLSALGPKLALHPHFPDGTNVELVEAVDAHTLEMRIWERGAGATASSGTGSAASAVAAIVDGRAESPVRVNCPGGVLRVEWQRDENAGHVFLSGEARVVFKGTYIGEV